MKYLLALLGAVLFGLPAALATRSAAESVQADPDPIAAAQVVHPGVPLQADLDPFPDEAPAWRSFLMARETHPPMVAPRSPVALDTGAARARASAAGWQTTDGLPGSYAFTAVKGDVALEVHPGWTVVLKRPAWWVTTLTVLAGLAGAALGAWLTMRARRLARVKNPRSRTAIRETAVVGVALLVPLLAQTTLDLLGVANPPLPYPAVLIVDLAGQRAR
ncbi:MAG: hypothetical protein SYR96_37305, partial [Actinomycetota bacterium]|nr:hypothetical protein [Actinomycetota bacterium]